MDIYGVIQFNIMKFILFISAFALLTASCSILNQNSKSEIPGLVAHYTFDGDAKDESKNGNDGAIFGATLTKDRFGKEKSAMNFDSNSSIIVPNSESLNFGKSDFAISLWFKAENNGNEQYQIIRKGNDNRTFGQGRWVISLDNIGRLRLVFEDSSGSYFLFNNSKESFLDSEWHHLIAIFDRDKSLSVLVDNEWILETSDIIYYGDSVNSANPLKIGQDDTGGTKKRFNGAIDDIRIYNRVLSDVEYADLFYND